MEDIIELLKQKNDEWDQEVYYIEETGIIEDASFIQGILEKHGIERVLDLIDDLTLMEIHIFLEERFADKG